MNPAVQPRKPTPIKVSIVKWLYNKAAFTLSVNYYPIRNLQVPTLLIRM